MDRDPYAEVRVGPNRVAVLKDGYQAFPAMLAAIGAMPEVKAAQPRFLDVIAARGDINDPGVQPLVAALVAAVQAAPATDAAALGSAIGNVLTGDVPTAFSEARTPDRSLIAGQSGPASDDEIEAGKFRIVPPSPVGDAKWSIALDMQIADVLVSGG